MKKPVNPQATRGFALVVTLSLMILLTVIAVGLLSLSSISLRSSSQGEGIARARSNARMALMLALGDLQREMGPDSRISAPQDAGTVATGGSPHWSAVYDAWTRAPGAGNAQETPDTRNPKFRGWLVSGANAANGGPPGTPERALMVGTGSLGGKGGVTDEVRVPMHVVEVEKRRGRIAWWVSDEGVKAKVNAGPDATIASSFGKADPLFQAQSPRNIGHRAVPVLSKLEWAEGKRAASVSTSQINLAAGLGSGGLGTAIHDITVHSAGVLADVRTGRLKRDLSNLLTRPLAQLENKPLYLADGRINWFDIPADGSVSNPAGAIPAWQQSYNSPSQWGINLEELHLFHSLHRELAWTGGQPRLQMKNTRLAVVRDRHFLYRRPSAQALQFIFSLRAVPDSSAGRYKMQMNLDAMVALANPNDIALEYPANLDLPFQLLNIPYSLNWNIQRDSGLLPTSPFTPGNLDVFMGHVEGGAGGAAPAGFMLEPGEAATFGSSTASGRELNIRRGFVPSGGVALTWDLKANNLLPTDLIDFEFKRITAPATGYAWTYYNTWIGTRGGGQGWQMDSASLVGGSLTGSLVDEYLPPSIRPPQVRPVSDFLTGAQPVLLISFLQNVEQSTGGTPPDAFASRPFLLNEPALNERSMDPSRTLTDRHSSQMLITAESMRYQFRTLAAGDGGRNIYIGGGRQPNLGGSFNVISRRIPVVPPLSLGAFQNAIASGFSDHFGETALRTQAGGNGLAVAGDPFPATNTSLSGNISALPTVSRAIGNSYNIPHLSPQEVYRQGGSLAAARAAVGKVATDHSWMVNTALWDPWFLSGIVDGTGSGSSPWQPDTRTPRAQFRDFAENKRSLRNTRFLFHPHKTATEALDELFTGENFKNSAINRLSSYLLVDGAFNVNSTSTPAWAALLSSVRDQSLQTTSGTAKSFIHPYGTLGYAANTATSGSAGDWAGLRDLGIPEIDRLAAAIVTEVKARGPFLSLADFVNRRPNSPDPAHQAIGALQAAIDRSGLNDRFATAARTSAAADFQPLAGSDGITKEPAPSRSVGAAGYLSQGHLLTAIGSQINVRSDTFVIRSYGDARDASDRIVATAWCEAVVQRVPEYLDPIDNPEAQAGWPLPSDTLGPANTRFGRRFTIQSFRWLSRGEI